MQADVSNLRRPESMGKSPCGAVVKVRAAVNVDDVDSSAALVDPVADAICAAPGAVAAARTADCRPGKGCSQARHRKTPVQQQQQRRAVAYSRRRPVSV